MKIARTLTPQDMQTQIKREVTTLPSQYLDGSLMYPGKWLLTLVKTPHMPWVLVSMTQYEGE